MQEKYNNLYEKIVALKEKVDNNQISMDSLSNVETTDLMTSFSATFSATCSAIAQTYPILYVF